MQLINLFPIPLGFFSLDRELSSSELEFLLNQETRKNVGNVSSINSYLLEDKSLQDLRGFIDLCLNRFIQDVYKPSANTSFRITQSWANYTKQAQFHHQHTHPNSFVSGVFYIKAKEDNDRIYFFNQKHDQIRLMSTDYNMFNSRSWWFPVKTGQLVLFPSSLSHMVETKGDDELRASLAFNTFPSGVLGDRTELTELML